MLKSCTAVAPGVTGSKITVSGEIASFGAKSTGSPPMDVICTPTRHPVPLIVKTFT